MNNEATETIKDLMPQTPDLNAERLAKLKELFPDLFTDEGGLNESELMKLVDPKSVNETERYEFRWFGKSNAKRKAFTPTTATLNLDAKRSVNPNDAENLIIEGENLKVLKLLLCSYREQIKCIYIDPPYNTGKDFVYSDNYSEDRLPYWKQTNVVDEYGVKIDTNADTDGRYHSNWMNMMFSRLLVARQLLRKDGVIFISIDDNEVHNLRRLCNEVFGEDNFVSQIPWQARQSIQNDIDISDSHEYIVVYAKNRRKENRRLKESNKKDWYNEETFAFYPKELDKSKFSNPDNDPRGDWKADPFDAPNIRPNLTYEIVNPNTNEVFMPPYGRCWRTEEKEYKKLLKDNRILFGRTGDSRPQLKVFYKEKVEFGTVIDTWFDGNTFGTATKGTKTMQSLFDGASPFDTSKPVELIFNLLKFSTRQNDLVLDFFGGSGTTGQAVMELNEADGGNRKFILVQLPERTDEKSEAYKAGYKLISDITIERNKRVINRIIEEKRRAHPNLFDEGRNTHEVSVSSGKTSESDDEENTLTNVRVSAKTDAQTNLGFKVFKLEKSYFPRTEWTPNPDAGEPANVQSLKDYIAAKESQLRIDFDHDKLLTEILLKEGFKLNYIVKPFAEVKTNKILFVSDEDKEALICLDNTIETETVEYFKTHKDLKFICLERGLDTTKKWNLANSLGEKFRAI